MEKKDDLLISAFKKACDRRTAQYSEARDMQVNGHDIVQVQVHWTKWNRRNGPVHSAKTKTHRQQSRALTCKTCWASGTVAAFRNQLCKQSAPRNFCSLKRTWWKYLMENGIDNPARMAKAWGTTVEQVNVICETRRRDVC